LTVCQASGKLKPKMGLAWHRMAIPGDNSTLQYHSQDPYGWHEMVQHQLIWCRDRKQHQFWLKFVDSVPSFWQAQAQNGIGLAQIGHIRRLFCITTSSARPTWMIWNGSAPTDMVPWPQTASIWLKFVDSVPSFWQAQAQNGIGFIPFCPNTPPIFPYTFLGIHIGM
jgi:hypothetical protein